MEAGCEAVCYFCTLTSFSWATSSVPVPEPFSAFAIFLSSDLSCEIEAGHGEESEGEKRAAAD
jgi:hypothetical protein